MEMIMTLATAALLMAFIVTFFRRSLSSHTDPAERSSLVTLIGAGIAFKCVIVFGWFMARGENVDVLWQDTMDYHRTASYLAGQFGNFEFLNKAYLQQIGAHPGYNVYLGILYYIFGQHGWVASCFNIISSVSVALVFYTVALHLFDKEVAKYTLLLNLFFPNYIPFDFFILKDNTALLLLSLATLGVILATGRQRWHFFLIPLCLVPILYFFRGEMTVVLLAALALHVLLAGMQQEGSKKGLVVSMTLLVMLLVAGQYLKPADRSALDRLSDFSLGEGAYGGNQIPGFLDGATGIVDVLQRIAGNPFAFALHVLKSLYLMLFGPTYFYAQSGPALFYKYDRFIFWDNLTGLCKLFLAPLIGYGYWTVLREHFRRCFAIWFFPLGWFCLLLLAQEFFRWILPAIPFLLLCAGVGLQRLAKVRQVYIVYVVAVADFVFFSINCQDSLPLSLLPALVTLAVLACLVCRCSFRAVRG